MESTSDGSLLATPPNNRAINWLTENRSGAVRRSQQRRHRQTYNQTPGARQLFSNLCNTRTRRLTSRETSKVKSTNQPQTTPQSWKALADKTWRVHRMSPLYKFSFDDLVKYSKDLSAHIKTISTGLAVDVDDKVDMAKVAPLQACLGTNTNGVEVLLMQQQRGGQLSRVVLTAILCFYNRTDSQNTDLSNISENIGDETGDFTAMPLMLIKGPVKLNRELIDWWQVAFDCCISPMIFSSIELCWMVAMYAGGSPETVRSRPVQFVYALPEKVDGISTITYDVNSQDCRRLWQSIGGTQRDDCLEAGQVVAFVDAIEQHFRHHFGIHLSAMKLVKIGTFSVHASCDGRLKIFSEGSVQQILTHVDQVARWQMDT